MLEQDNLTCCHPDWTALGRIIFSFIFSESADMFLLTRGGDKKCLLKLETDNELLR